MTFQEFITSTSEADVAAVLTQLLQLHAAYSITCQAADFVEVWVTDLFFYIVVAYLFIFYFCVQYCLALFLLLFLHIALAFCVL